VDLEGGDSDDAGGLVDCRLGRVGWNAPNVVRRSLTSGAL